MQGITIVGLGPGDPGLITRQAWRLLENSSELYVRTNQHPVIQKLPRQLKILSFDEYYKTEADFEAVYASIVARVLELGGRPEGVIYAVPGHPYMAEATSPAIARRAREIGIPCRVVAGLSFLEPVMAAIGVDPLPQLTLIDGLELATRHTPPFPPGTPALVAQIYSQDIASEVKLSLMAAYPDEHPVKLVHAAGTESELVENLALFEIDRSRHTGLLTALYIPPLGPGTGFEDFQEIIAHLRAPDGCPWDREQDHQTLRPYLLEETYETLAALDGDDPDAMREELGDLLLQIVLHAQIGTEYGEFTMAEVLQGIYTKIISRHPHVFGDVDVEDVGGVLLNWEKLKQAERAANGKEDASLLDGVAGALPALVQSQEYQRRAARVGFDWPDISGVVDKLVEELGEVRTAGDQVGQEAELGDLLFAVVNLARWYGVDAESALRAANERFRKRFAFIEREARIQGRGINDLNLDEMEAFWQQAKRSG